MKNRIYLAILFVVALQSFNVAIAQTNVNLEQVNIKGNNGASPKFIEDIEIQPIAIRTVVPASSNENEFTPSTPSEISNSSFNNLMIEKCNAIQFKYALLTDREVEAITNNQLYNFIEEWWATPYKYGGTDKGGIDCSSFTGKIMASIYNIPIARTASEQYQQCEKVAIEDLKEGDLLFFNTSGGISHVGLYLGNNYFVHSSVQSGVTISSIADGYYHKKLVSCGRVESY